MQNKKIGESLLKNDSTRLRFSVWVIIANFIIGIVGIFLGSDLTALGVFLAMSNTPLYAYILGRTFRGATVPDQYYEQPHGGSGGIPGGNYNNRGGWYHNGRRNDDYDYGRDRRRNDEKIDDYNIPIEKTETTKTPEPIETVQKDESEIG